MKLKHIFALLAAAVVGLASFFMSVQDEEPRKGDKPKGESAGREIRRRPRRNIEERQISERDGKPMSRKPPVIEELPEDEELDEEMRGMLDSIRKSLSAGDLAGLREVLARMKAASAAAGAVAHNWAQHIPVRLRSAAVEAVGYFGAEAMIDLLDFVADDDPDVARDAIDQLELALQDSTLGDRERAEVIKSICSVLTDSSAIDWMLSTATDARHSVGIETFAFIAENGTPEAKQVLADYIDLFTGGEGVTTIADAERWLVENPDDPGDEEFYGGQPEAK